ncbi:MAG: hypothetical protein NTY22_07210, partial [Proteobacteria bacterium]|nr:hypothetical protein [Pseudomonadota bacterium]
MDSISIVLLVPLFIAGSGQFSQGNSITIYVERIFKSMGISFNFTTGLLIFVLIISIKGVIVLFQGIYQSSILSLLGKRIRLKIVRSIMGVNYQYYIKRNSGFYNNLITTEVDRARAASGNYVFLISNTINVLI